METHHCDHHRTIARQHFPAPWYLPIAELTVPSFAIAIHLEENENLIAVIHESIDNALAGFTRYGSERMDIVAVMLLSSV